MRRETGVPHGKACGEGEVELGWSPITSAVAQTAPLRAGDVPMHVLTSIVRDIVRSF